MDERSHELFAKILLRASEKSETFCQWGKAPDIDMTFMHRWYRHRINIIDKTALQYAESNNIAKVPKKLLLSNVDKDAITLCIVSHLYLDIFNGWVFPFGLWYPIYPDKTVISGVIGDINKPKLMVKELRRLSFGGDFAKQFYEESEKIMTDAIVTNCCSTERLVDSFIYMLSGYIHNSDKTKTIYKKAINDIEKFTSNKKYALNIDNIDLSFKYHQFETKYAKLIDRSIEA